MDVKLLGSAEWRSKRGGFKLNMRQFGKLTFRISCAGLCVGVYNLLELSRSIFIYSLVLKGLPLQYFATGQPKQSLNQSILDGLF